MTPGLTGEQIRKQDFSRLHTKRALRRPQGPVFFNMNWGLKIEKFLYYFHESDTLFKCMIYTECKNDDMIGASDTADA